MRFSAILCAFALAAVAVLPVSAQRTTSEQVVQTYINAQKLLDEGKTREALELVREQMRSEDLTADDRVVLERFEAQLEVELSGGELDPDLYRRAKEGPQTERERQETYFFLGRLYLATDVPDYDKAVENLREYVAATDNPDPDAYYYLAEALMKKGQCREAIPQAEKAIALSKTPKENHYRLLLSCHAKLDHHREVIPLAERIVKQFGAKDAYLKSLAEAHRALGQKEDAFLIEAQRHELGFLETEEEILRLTEGYLARKNPHRAARILEAEMKAGRVRRSRKNIDKLGDLWFEAREWKRARDTWFAHTGRQVGEDELKVAKTYLEEHNWKSAERHLRRGLNKGGLNEPCKVRLLLAQVLRERKDRAAIKEYDKAAASESCNDEQKRRAKGWAEYLKLEEISRHPYPSRQKQPPSKSGKER